MVLSTGIGLEIRDSQFRTWNQSRNRNRVLGMFSLGTGIGIEFWACSVSEPESESSPRLGQSQNRNRNRAPGLDSLGTGIGIEKIGTGNLCLDCAFVENTLFYIDP